MSARSWAERVERDEPDLAAFFLGRLAALLARQAAASPAERAALARAAFSVYLDCRDLGLEREARRLLARPRAASAPPERAAA
ncbi:MAG TPA: hypothetical protein VFL91_00220 [Thermomicrobiales bacterium]|nr:hypothetical protein [Thermomicrobiales bacterium]